jgi:ParB-like chromosome segregation protein Spo0J
MKVEGLIHPIEVDENYTIIVGEMRYRAAKSLGWSEINANIYKGSITPYERLRRQMAENLQQSGAKGGGQPMNSIDTAKAWAKLYELKTGKDWRPGHQSREEVYGIIKSIAEEVGVLDDTIHEHLSLLEQPDYIIKDLLKGRPRTFYREAETLPEKIGEIEIRESIKKGISEGRIQARDEITRLRRTLATKPEKAGVEMARIFDKQSTDANKILDRALELQIVLKNATPDKWTPVDKTTVKDMLRSTSGTIRQFLGELNKD